MTTPLAHRTLSRGVLSIASFLEKSGFHSEIVPFSFHLGFNRTWSNADLRTTLKTILPEKGSFLFGVSNQFSGDYPTALKILQICKELNEKAITIIGGVHVTFLDMECIKSPYVDIVVRGEGEWTFLDLVRAFEDNSDLTNIKGITFKKNNEIVRNEDRPLGKLDELPKLNFSLLPREFVKNVFVHGMLNRGCDFNCSFCGESAFWKRRRSFHLEKTIAEMETLDREYDNPMCALDDSMAYIGSQQFTSLCHEIRSRNIRLHKNFYLMSRVDSFQENDLGNLEGTGIQYVQLGIESGSPAVLKMMNKKTSREKIIDCCVKLKKHNLYPYGLWMIGHPGDNPEEEEHSLELLEFLLKNNLMEKVEISVFAPCPGTDFFNHPEKYGIEILIKDWSKWQQYYIEEPVSQLENFSAAEIMKCYKKAHLTVMREKPEALRYTQQEFL